MGTLAGLPTLNPKLDNETKDLVTTLNSVQGHGFAKIVTVTHGEDFLLKNIRGGKRGVDTLEKLRPDLIGIKKISMSVINVGHDYNKMIKNQLTKIGGNPDDFNPEACRYSTRFSDNGLVRQNTKDELAFYLRYFVGVNQNNYKSYEEYFVNAKGDVVEVTAETKAQWFNAKGGSVKQAIAGVEKEVKPQNVRLDNLYYFQRGEEIFNRMTPEIMNLLDLEYVK